jgi:hypothetical protein
MGLLGLWDKFSNNLEKKELITFGCIAYRNLTGSPLFTQSHARRYRLRIEKKASDLMQK